MLAVASLNQMLQYLSNATGNHEFPVAFRFHEQKIRLYEYLITDDLLPFDVVVYRIPGKEPYAEYARPVGSVTV